MTQRPVYTRAPSKSCPQADSAGRPALSFDTRQVLYRIALPNLVDF